MDKLGVMVRLLIQFELSMSQRVLFHSVEKKQTFEYTK